MNKKTLDTLKLTAGIAVVSGSLAAPVSAMTDGGNPFAMTELGSGYQVADMHEGKCGEGKCGEDKNTEGKCGEGKCGEDKNAEGKCGEGKCGEGKDAEGKCGEGKDAEGKCGGDS